MGAGGDRVGGGVVGVICGEGVGRGVGAWWGIRESLGLLNLPRRSASETSVAPAHKSPVYI